MNEEQRRGRGRPPKMGLMFNQDNPEMSSVNNGRDFMCSICGKTYLSNPALYLHMKVKHIQGEGREINGEFKRGRGRPKKNVRKHYFHLYLYIA